MIIMISGFRGAGKDTLGSQIINKLENFTRYAFADELKDIASYRYGFDRELADIREEKDKPRPEYNSSSIRDLGRNVWLEIKETNPTKFSENIASKMKEDLKKNNKMNFVITDFRYQCDYNTLVKYFGKQDIITIRINRDGIEIPNEEKEPEEYALKNFNFNIYIQNRGTFEELWDNFIKNLWNFCEHF